MIRRPPRSTRTDTLFPYTTLFRSYADLVTLDPDPAGLTATINGSVLGLENSTGLPYDPANVVAFIDSRTRNVARQRFSGLALSIRYQIGRASGRERECQYV